MIERRDLQRAEASPKAGFTLVLSLCPSQAAEQLLLRHARRCCCRSLCREQAEGQLTRSSREVTEFFSSPHPFRYKREDKPIHTYTTEETVGIPV